MYKFIASLVLLSSANLVLAQGNSIYPQTTTMAYPFQIMPPTTYYPTVPYAYPSYPYQGVQPYYPQPASSLPYPYGVYPNMSNGYLLPNAGAAGSVTAPSYLYTSPYDPSQPATPGPKPAPAPEVKKETKPWGDTRYIWPDFYTDQTSDLWDKMINSPHDLGDMPGGWRFPSFSSPDPVTVGDAVANQVPPIVEEVPNFMNFTN